MRSLLHAALLLAACSDDPVPSQVFTIELVTPSGENPLVDAETVRIRVQQGEGELVEREVPVSGGALSSDVPLADLVSPVRIGVEVTGGGPLRIGAPPVFGPIEAAAGFLVRIPVAVPDTCAPVSGMVLDGARRDVAVALHGTFALTAGGGAAAGPSSSAGFLDLLELDTGAFEPLPFATGPARAAAYNATQSVVLSENAAPFRYDISSSEMPVLAGNLHAGAGLSSALVVLGAEGAAVVGGRDGTTPVADVTWIASDGATTSSTLATPRAGAAAVALAAGILVVGGSAETWAELVPVGGDGRALDLAGDGRRGGTLVAAGDGMRALLVGGTDAAGEPIASTLLFTCDAGTCTEAPGPTFARARTRFAAAHLPSGGAILAGGAGPVAWVDRVSFDADAAYVEPIGDLVTARADAAAFAIEAGLVYVVGGEGESAPLADVELCFPRSLAFP